MDRSLIAIADVLRHRTLGLVSYQPGEGLTDENMIQIRDMSWELLTVSVDDCEPATKEEIKAYRKNTRSGLTVTPIAQAFDELFAQS